MTEDLLVRTVEERQRQGEVWTRYGDHRVLLVGEAGETGDLPGFPHIAASEELELELGLEVRAVSLTTRLRCLHQLLLQLEDSWTASYLVAAAQVRRKAWCFPH